MTAKKVAEQHAIAFTTAQRAIAALEAYEIVIKTAGDKRNRVYCATKILAILDEPARMEHSL